MYEWEFGHFVRYKSFLFGSWHLDVGVSLNAPEQAMTTW